MRTRAIVAAPLALLLGACATVPTGPSVMVLPGSAKSFEQFQADDGVCRQWAHQQTGTTTGKAANSQTVTGAVVGTAVGAAAGAALGAAAGNPAVGAAVGAGQAEGAYRSVQQRYNMAYMQCMYAKGNQIPVARGSVVPGYSSHTPPPPPPPARTPAVKPPPNIPPPPPGTPPPPPPGVKG